MDTRKRQMLSLLDDQIQNCDNCNLHYGGRCKPYWTENFKYVLIGEAPGKNEVEENTPFCGKAGKHLWDAMNKNGLNRDDFLIINSVNCRPVKDGKNGKPELHQMEKCKKWINKYVRVANPSKILLLGNYALGTILGYDGIMRLNGMVFDNEEFQCKVVASIHPSMCIYRRDEGRKMLEESIGVFSNVVV